MEEGKLQLKKEAIDMAAVAADVVSHFSVQAESKGILLCHAASDHLPSIPADAMLMKRVLSNLLTNAIRHTPAGGSIAVRTGFISEPPTFECRVKDTGTGVDAQYRDKIFDKFEQTALKEAGVKVGSSGLGLAFCKMAVEAHGGRIWVESEGKGKGSTFIIQLPAHQNSVKEKGAAGPADHSTRKARVLIIDDEGEIRQLLYDIVISQGHQAELACDGMQGLELFNNRDFDLVCTDLGMPGISGWQVAEGIKQTGKKVPVAVITGWSVIVSAKEMQEKGVNMIVQKPFQINKILELVQEGLLMKDRFEAAR
jgi:CheY-like chemotaxis protein